MSIHAERERFRGGVAQQLAAQLSSGLRPFVANRALSKRFVFFDDGDRLVVLAGDQEGQRDVDRALAFGLAWQGDRDLVVVLPEGKAMPTLHRLAFLRPGTRVFSHRGSAVAEQVIPARHEVWADAHEQGNATTDSSADALIEGGRMTIRVQRTRNGLRVSAGVHEGSYSGNYVELKSREITGPLDAAMLATLKEAASATIAERLGGGDTGHLEHLLQSRLGDHPEMLGLLPNELGKPRRYFRELPCVRPGAGRNYIDLAGLDAQGRFHVVETKIGGDEMLALQGLDYYVWALAHRDQLSKHLGLAKLEIVLDFVVASKGEGEPAIGPYTTRQVEALDGSIPWRFSVVTDWHTDDPKIQRGGRREVPGPPASAAPVIGPRFAVRTQAHVSKTEAEPADKDPR